jgi:predicted transcriptional regulator
MKSGKKPDKLVTRYFFSHYRERVIITQLDSNTLSAQGKTFLLEKIRVELGLSVTDFCVLIAIGRKSYYRYKNSETEPELSVRTWKQLSLLWTKRLGKNLEDFPESLFL